MISPASKGALRGGIAGTVIALLLFAAAALFSGGTCMGDPRLAFVLLGDWLIPPLAEAPFSLDLFIGFASFPVAGAALGFIVGCLVALAAKYGVRQRDEKRFCSTSR